MTHFELLQALQNLGPDSLPKAVMLMDDDGIIHPIRSFLTPDKTEDLTDDPFQPLFLWTA